MLSARTVGVVTLGVVLSACGAKGFEPAPLPVFKTKIDARFAWKASIGPAGGYIFSPVRLGDIICAADSERRLSCFDVGHGKSAWVRKVGVTFSGGVGASENMILMGTAKGEVLAYDAHGTMLWRSRVSSEVLSAPTGARGVVVVRSGDSKVFGLDAKDGRNIWEYQAPPQTLTVRSDPRMVVINDDSVIGGFPGGRLIRLDVRQGGLLWNIAVATPSGDNELERLTDVAGTPFLEEGQVCAVAYQGRIGCFETKEGAQIWAREASSAGNIAADSGNLYYTEADSVIVALHKGTGASVWRQESLLYRRVTAPAVVGDWIVVGDFKGYVHILSSDDGAFVARLATDGSAITAAPLTVDNRVVVQTEAGGLYMIGFER